MKQAIFSILTVFLLIQCTPMKLSVSDDLKSDHDEYSVKGRQGILIKQKLSFGDYRTTHVKRSWTKGHSSRTGLGSYDQQQQWVNLISMEYVNKKQTVNFNLTDGRQTSEVYCVSKFQAEDLQIGRRENSILNIAMDIAGFASHSSSLYYVQMFMDESGTPWQLVLDNQASQAAPKKYMGIIARSRSEYYTLVPVTKLEKNGKSGNTLLGSVGFEMRDPQGRTVAAVSMIDNGMVFLRKTSAEERFILANVCAALLLQEEIG